MGKLEIFRGALLTFMLPSLNEVTIREQGAEDDDILGKISEGDMIDALNEFVATIVVSSSFETSRKDGALNIKDAEALPLRDKHYILLKSRLHSMGNKMEFDYVCQNKKCNKKETYAENLEDYDQDLSLIASTEVPEGKHVNCITRYPTMIDKQDYKKSFESTLSSGRKVRLHYLNGVGEKEVLAANKNKALTTNTEYLVRSLEVYQEDGWVKVSSMNIFSKRDVIEISKLVKLHDTQFTPQTHLTCPNCDHEAYLPLLAIKDFFFPTEI